MAEARPCGNAPEFLRNRETSHNEFIMQRVPFRRTPAPLAHQKKRLAHSPHFLKLQRPSGLKQKFFCFPVSRLRQAALRASFLRSSLAGKRPLRPRSPLPQHHACKYSASCRVIHPTPAAVMKTAMHFSRQPLQSQSRLCRVPPFARCTATRHVTQSAVFQTLEATALRLADFFQGSETRRGIFPESGKSSSKVRKSGAEIFQCLENQLET